MMMIMMVVVAGKNKYIFYNFLARNTQGDDGAVQQSLIQHGSLEEANKQSFPLELIKIMERKAVDLLLTSSDNKGRDILTFIVSLTEGRSELVQFKKGYFSVYRLR